MTPWPYPFWFAHRGAGRLAPENTLAAFRVGASHGWRAFECDVKLSADGVPFLLHDTTLQRTTRERGVASLRRWDELARIDAGACHSPAFAGEPIPSLQAVAEECLRHGWALNIEIKPTPGDEALTGQIVGRDAQRLWRDAAPKPLLSSFDAIALGAARAAAPDLPRALLIDTRRGRWLDTALGLDCVALVAEHTLVDAALIGRLHQAGLRVLAYTVNDAAVARRLVGWGIDGIVSDAIDRFAPDAAMPR